jgi:hypothetical protein
MSITDGSMPSFYAFILLESTIKEGAMKHGFKVQGTRCKGKIGEQKSEVGDLREDLGGSAGRGRTRM